MNVKYMFSLIAVIVFILLSYAGVEAWGLHVLFGVLIPYAALLIFIGGVVYRITNWAKSPVPFRIPTTCGQARSLPWIKQSRIDDPDTTGGVILRMALEILLFRSLFRNTKYQWKEGDRLTYIWEKWLWIAALAFHYAFATVVIRHLRFFMEPVPFWLQLLESADSFLRIEYMSDFIQIGLPGIFLSGLVLLAAVIYLLLRRIFIPQVKYISIASDFFPLFLIIAIAGSGILMRYIAKVDIVTVKEFAMGLITLNPVPPVNVGAIFYVHLFLVCVLLVYFPFSKLMHAGGIFMSPTRNMANNSRSQRHVNPWNYPVKVHTYEEYEDEFRDKMIEAGLPVEKKE